METLIALVDTSISPLVDHLFTFLRGFIHTMTESVIPTRDESNDVIRSWQAASQSEHCESKMPEDKTVSATTTNLERAGATAAAFHTTWRT